MLFPAVVVPCTSPSPGLRGERLVIREKERKIAERNGCIIKDAGTEGEEGARMASARSFFYDEDHGFLGAGDDAIHPLCVVREALGDHNQNIRS